MRYRAAHGSEISAKWEPAATETFQSIISAIIAPMPVSHLGQVAVTVLDVKAATEFYRDKVGLRFLFDAPPNLAFFDVGGVRLMFSPPESSARTCNSVLYFTVEDIRAEYDRMLRIGVSFEGEPHRIAKLPDREIWMAFFRDPEQNLMALISEPRIQ